MKRTARNGLLAMPMAQSIINGMNLFLKFDGMGSAAINENKLIYFN